MLRGLRRGAGNNASRCGFPAQQTYETSGRRRVLVGTRSPKPWLRAVSCATAAIRCVWTELTKCGTFPTLVFRHVADAAFLYMCGKILAAMQLRSRNRPLRGMISRNAEVILFCVNRAPKRRQVRRHDLELCTSQKGRTVFFGYENGRITLQPEFTRFMEHVDQRFWRACCDGPSDAARKKCPVGRHIAQ